MSTPALTIVARVVRFAPMPAAEVRAFAAEAAEHDDDWTDDLAALDRGELVALRMHVGFEVEQDGRPAWWPQHTVEPALVPVDGSAPALARVAADQHHAGDDLAFDLRLDGYDVDGAQLDRLPLRFELDPDLGLDVPPTLVEPGTRDAVVPMRRRR